LRTLAASLRIFPKVAFYVLVRIVHYCHSTGTKMRLARLPGVSGRQPFLAFSLIIAHKKTRQTSTGAGQCCLLAYVRVIDYLLRA